MKKQKDTGTALIPQEYVEGKILLIRNKKVMLDKDLAELYGVETRALNQAVKRNNDRFPRDFMFQLTKTEANLLVSQNVIPLNSMRKCNTWNNNLFYVYENKPQK